MTDSEAKANAVVQNMLSQDRFSDWLGIRILKIEPGYASIEMDVKNEMLNGFQIAHGGICYSFADSALAFASNSHGTKAVSIETSISHILTVQNGDTLLAEAKECHLSTKFGVYEVVVFNQYQKKVAIFKGTVYRTGQAWEKEDSTTEKKKSS